MGRHRKRRHIENSLGSRVYKPVGIPLFELTGVSVAEDGVEAMRLVDHLGLSQEEAAARMGVSAPTLCRMLAAARGALARALSSGMAVRIEAADQPDLELGLTAREAALVDGERAAGGRPGGCMGNGQGRGRGAGGRCRRGGPGAGQGCGQTGQIDNVNQAPQPQADEPQAAPDCGQGALRQRQRDGSCRRKS